MRAATDAMLRSMSTRLARFVFLAFGFIAVSALLVQPICEAAEHVAASGGDEGDACCCPVAGPDALVAASPLAGEPSIPAPAVAVAAPVFRPRIVVSAALPASAAAPPLVPGYYVRSARIQR